MLGGALYALPACAQTPLVYQSALYAKQGNTLTSLGASSASSARLGPFLLMHSVPTQTYTTLRTTAARAPSPHFLFRLELGAWAAIAATQLMGELLVVLVKLEHMPTVAPQSVSSGRCML